MNKKIISFTVLLLFFITSYANKYGIIVINSRYEDPTIEELAYSENVLKIVSNIFEKLNIPEENILKIYGKTKGDNTRNKIIKDIYYFSHKIETQIQEGDTIFFYYSGHGDYGEESGKNNLYIVPEDAIKDLKETYIPLNLIFNLLRRNINNNITIINIFDACYLGKQDIAEIPTFDSWITIGISEKTSDNVLTKNLSDIIDSYLKNPTLHNLTVKDLYKKLNSKIPGITVYPKVAFNIHSKFANGNAQIFINTNLPDWMIKKGYLIYSVDESTWETLPITKMIYLQNLSPGEHLIQLKMIRENIEEKIFKKYFKIKAENSVKLKIKFDADVLAKIKFLDKNGNILNSVKLDVANPAKYYKENDIYIIKSNNFHLNYIIKAYYNGEKLNIILNPEDENFDQFKIITFNVKSNSNGDIAIFNFNDFSSDLLAKINTLKVLSINNFNNLKEKNIKLLVIFNNNWASLYWLDKKEKEEIKEYLENGGKILSFYDSTKDSFLLTNELINYLKSYEEYENGVFSLNDIKIIINSRVYSYIPPIDANILGYYNNKISLFYINRYNGKIFICGINPLYLNEDDLLYIFNTIKNIEN